MTPPCRSWWQDRALEADPETDRGLLALMGEPTEEKRWLAASPEKTIRLQMDPSPEMRAAPFLAGPDWIRKRES